MVINLSDNCLKPTDKNTFSRHHIAPLFPYGNKTIEQLCKENNKLLIYPYSIEETDDRISKSVLFEIVNTRNPDDVYLATGSIMGFIGVGNLQLNIRSRFDIGRDNYLLHYMLQKVLSMNIFDLEHQSESISIFDFLAFMFPRFLNRALQQGLYREYQSFKYNDACVKGVLDVNRHIAHNVPFCGTVAYKTREFSFDNSLTQLVRHTIEYIKTKKYGPSLLGYDKDTRANISLIVQHTSSYCKQSRKQVIQNNLRLKSHPYYCYYDALQSLCLQILKQEDTKYGEGSSELYGILFDGAWLWEEYLNTILKKMGFVHPENKKGKGGIYLFEDYDQQMRLHRNGLRYPDFYKDGIVLDAKYKQIASYDMVSKVSRDDIHQIITYMKHLNAKKGAFLAPVLERQVKIPMSRLADGVSNISIFGLEISKSTDFSIFCEEMSRNEDRLVQRLS